MEGVGVTGLEAVVELLPDRPPELVHELVGVDEVERPDTLLCDARRLVQEREVGLDLPRRAGTLHLDRDSSPVRKRRTVDLTDRGGRDRSGIELGEELVDREAEVFLDHILDVAEREGTDIVLEPTQLGDDVRREDIGTRREELPELHERGAELVQHLAEVLAALRRLAVDFDARSAPRKQIR